MYQRELDKILKEIVPGEKRLLLHSCCAPCSSYCMEYLRQYFEITVFYYNPNITNDAEYRKRVEEQKRLIETYNHQVDLFEKYQENAVDLDIEKQVSEVASDYFVIRGMRVDKNTNRIGFVEGDYDPEAFLSMAKGLEDVPEGGERCFGCYALRLKKTAELAEKEGFDYFTTTLTISPLKNAAKLNEIGKKLENEMTLWLPSDFKKKNGYKRSIELSKEFDLYRQNYCGCEFSKREQETKQWKSRN